MTTTDQFISALCNTLAYSLWQGVILAAIAGIIVIITRKSTSALRYNLLTGALALFAVSTVVTFLTQFKLAQPAAGAVSGGNNFAFASPIVVQPFNGHVIVESGSIFSMLKSYLDNYHNTIVCIWFLIICIKSIQFGVGLYGTYILKRSNIFPPNNFWKERAMQLACLTGVKQVIDIVESGLARVPMVIGHLKPVILIPVGMLTALSSDEIEVIIIHELAHVKRRDYLVNMLQSLLEIIFFFNPAVLWISNLIKVERENCCDDIALAQNGNKSSYIHALVLCEEFQSTIPAYAMAFPGSKNSLLNRVKRMANNRNHSLNQFEKAFLAICLVMSGLCLSAFAAKDHIRNTVHEVVKVLQHTVVDIKEQQKLVKQTETLQKQTELVEKSKPTITDTTKKPINVTVDPKVAVDPAVFVNVQPQVSANVIVPTVSVNVDPKITTNTRITMAPVTVNPQVNVTVQPRLGRLSANLGALHVNLNNLSDTIRYRNSAYYRKFKAIVQELFKMNIVTDTNRVSLNLNERMLIVNGKRQPDDVHKAIFEKFGKNGAGYGYQNNYGGNYSNVYSGSGNSSSSSSASNSGNGYSYSYTYNGDSTSNAAPRARPRATTAQRLARPQAAQRPVRSSERQEINEAKEKQITDDLLKDGLIKDADNINFSINTKEFILNGKKMDDAVFEKYKKKYGPEDGNGSWSWSHSHSGN